MVEPEKVQRWMPTPVINCVMRLRYFLLVREIFCIWHENTYFVFDTDLTVNDPYNRIHLIGVFRHVEASDQA